MGREYNFQFVYMFVTLMVITPYCTEASSDNKQNKSTPYSIEALSGGILYSKKLKHNDYKLKTKSQIVMLFGINRAITNHTDIFAQIIHLPYTKSTGRYNSVNKLYDVKHYYRSTSLMLGGKYHLAFIKPFAVYIKLGAGLTSNRSYEKHFALSGLDFEGQYTKKTKNNFTYLFGVGGYKKIHNGFNLLLEYNYFDQGKCVLHPV